MRKIIYCLLVFFLFFHVAKNAWAQEEVLAPPTPINTTYEKAKILEVREEKAQDPLEGEEITVQRVKLVILSGEHESEKYNLENNLAGNPLDINLKEGNKVIVYIEEFENQPCTVQIQDHYRLGTLVFMIALFFLFLGIIGKGAGIKAVLSLGLSAFLVFKVFIPAMLKGINPIFLVLLISVIITLVTLIIISGLRKKTYAAILGTLAGLIVATLMAVIFGRFAHLSGVSSGDARILFNQFPELNYRGILFAGIIIGALGAVMDVSVSIASAITEIKNRNPKISTRELFRSGMNVGRDIMGTMANTLIFAYVGASVFVLLLFTQYGESYLKFLNFSFVAEEVVRSMAGTIGLISAIPLTALFAAYLHKEKTLLGTTKTARRRPKGPVKTTRSEE